MVASKPLTSESCEQPSNILSTWVKFPTSQPSMFTERNDAQPANMPIALTAFDILRWLFASKVTSLLNEANQYAVLMGAISLINSISLTMPASIIQGTSAAML